MPTDILIYMIIAAVMVVWLRNVLGTRHGDERERPNPFDKANQPEEPQDIVDIRPAREVNKPAEPTTNGTADAGLVQIALADKNFDVPTFKENAADAFSIIVMAFADGDKETLKDLCTTEVYNSFAAAIDERSSKGEKISTEIHAVRKTDIVAAGVDSKKTAYVTVRFTADETYVVEDDNGGIIAGHPDRVTEMTDKWTFSRSIRSNDPRWFLSKTEDDVIEEDGKTPLPDAG